MRGPWAGRVRPHLDALAAAPARYLRTLAYCLRRPDLAAGYGELSTLGCFTRAVQVAGDIRRLPAVGDRATRVHAHFAHDPALVGLLVARLTGLPFSFTGHARDLLQIPPTALAARAASATALITCCAANADYVAAAVPAASRPPVLVIHHGVELARFRPSTDQAGGQVARLLSVGRLVQKKGFTDLLTALAQVAPAADFTCRIYGDGPLLGELTRMRDRLGLRERVQLMGAAGTDEIVAALGAADMFALTPRVLADGDRDGIPNVLVEAMACGLPVVTTSAGGIDELVRPDVNGLLAAPGDVAAVAASVERLLRDPALGRRLGSAARVTVEADYDIAEAARRLDDVFRTPVPARSGVAA